MGEIADSGVCIEQCDGIEIWPLINLNKDDADDTHYEPCSEADADVFGVFVHLKEGGLDWVADLKTHNEAGEFANVMLGAFPHLAERGIVLGY